MADFYSTIETGIGVLKLRAIAADADQRLAKALGIPEPRLGTLATGGNVDCIKLGPREWLITGPADALGEAQTRLADAFADLPALLVDMSHGSSVRRIEGPGAAGLINAYCELDLDKFPAGAATRTRFGDIALVLIRPDDLPAFRLIADQTYADYLDLLVHHGVTTD
jgi:sarcosine oxidase subunit gamma